MRFQRTMVLSGVLLLAGAAAPAQQAQPQAAPPVIRTETKLVLVDVVVTGKKGVYVEDLELKNFKVWEDNKEQQLKTFSSGADPNGPAGQKRYIVLFFDNSTMAVGEQVQARQAAARFIESNAGPDRLIAVVNFTNSLQIAQNFTGDIDRLKQVVGGIKSSGMAPGPQVASLGGPRLGGIGEYGARSMLLALRGMAKNLTEIPGRKSLILFTSGFPLSNEARAEANAAIDSCNKANVAIYPIDVRGVSGNVPGMLDDSSIAGTARARGAGISAGISRRCAALQRHRAGGFAGAAHRLVLSGRPRVGAAGRAGRRWCRRRQPAADAAAIRGRRAAASRAARPAALPAATRAAIRGREAAIRGAPIPATRAATSTTRTTRITITAATTTTADTIIPTIPTIRSTGTIPYNNPSRMSIPGVSAWRHRQSADHVPAGGRHRRVRHQQHERHDRRHAEDRQGTEFVLHRGLHAARVGGRQLPHAEGESGQGWNHGAFAGRLLQREIARRAGGQSDRKDAGEPRDGAGGRHDRGVDARAVLLYGGEHGARGGGHRDSRRRPSSSRR